MLNRPSVTRRAFVGLASASALVLSGAVRAIALDNQQASDLIGRLVVDVNQVINSGKPETAMFRDFEKVLEKYGDINIIARSSLGVAWRSASSGQRSRYVRAFQGYIARKYGRRFREFIGGEIVVVSSKKVKSGYLVSSVAHLRGEAPFSIDWQVSDKSGRDKMFNMYIEGISLLATERTEILAMLDKRHGNLNKLIADIEKMR